MTPKALRNGRDIGQMAWSWRRCAEGFTSLVAVPHITKAKLSPHCFRLRHMRCRHFAGNLVTATRYTGTHWIALLSLRQVRSCLLLRILVWKCTRVACSVRAEQEDSVLTQIANLCVQLEERRTLQREQNETRRSPGSNNNQLLADDAASGEWRIGSYGVVYPCWMRFATLRRASSMLLSFSLVFAQTI